MKLTQKQLRAIIKEEMSQVNERDPGGGGPLYDIESYVLLEFAKLMQSWVTPSKNSLTPSSTATRTTTAATPTPTPSP